MRLDKLSPEVWETKKFDDVLLQLCSAVFKQNTIVRDGQKVASSLSPRKVTSELLRTTEA